MTQARTQKWSYPQGNRSASELDDLYAQPRHGLLIILRAIGDYARGLNREKREFQSREAGSMMTAAAAATTLQLNRQ